MAKWRDNLRNASRARKVLLIAYAVVLPLLIVNFVLVIAFDFSGLSWIYFIVVALSITTFIVYYRDSQRTPRIPPG
jgi:ABC-type iron transport system FetAB permease component